MSLSLVVLAAGMGSRYGGLKQIDPVGPAGELIIDYSIYDAINAGFSKVIFVIRKDIEKDFRKIIGKRFESKVEIQYAYQELDKLPPGFRAPLEREKPWGTAHAILTVREVIEEPFAVINADDFYGKSGYKLLADVLSHNAKFAIPEYYMVGFKLGNTLSEHGHVARGICKVDSNNYLLEIKERTKIEKTNCGAKFTDENGNVVFLTGEEIVSMNMWGFYPSIFTYLEEQFIEFLKDKISDPKAEFFIPTVIGNLLNDGKIRVKVLQSTDKWCGVTYKEDKSIVVENIKKLIQAGVYPEKLIEMG